MVYYPLSALMLAGIRDDPDHHHAARQAALQAPARRRRRARASASAYAVQPSPDGLAQAFVIGARLRRRRPRAPGPRRQHLLRRRTFRMRCSARPRPDAGATVFGYHGAGPGALRRRRVRRQRPRRQHRGEAGAAAVELRRDRPLFLRQPTCSTSPPALKPSARGELEITDVNRDYLRTRRAARRAARPRLRVARHRHARIAAAGVAVRPDDRGAAGAEDRLPRGDRLPDGLHRRRST